ncbi:MAG: hypothetical protein RET84_07005 [Pseudomonadota bacterium]|nr:hypothetical protein [Pseudomonadota bacterium]
MTDAYAGDESQIQPPPSFLALHTDPRRQRLSLPLAEVRARYELCEDLAQALTEHARALSQGGTVSDNEVLQRCHAGLATPESGLSPAEAEWVVRRLAELLDWSQPADFPSSP